MVQREWIERAASTKVVPTGSRRSSWFTKVLREPGDWALVGVSLRNVIDIFDKQSELFPWVYNLFTLCTPAILIIYPSFYLFFFFGVIFIGELWGTQSPTDTHISITSLVRQPPFFWFFILLVLWHYFQTISTSFISFVLPIISYSRVNALWYSIASW